MAHLLCFRKTWYRQHVLCLNENSMVSCCSFDGESSFTAFYDGMLLAVAPGFPADLFWQELKLLRHDYGGQLPVDILLSHPLYLPYADSPDNIYHLYQLVPIDWTRQSFLPETALVRIC